MNPPPSSPMSAFHRHLATLFYWQGELFKIHPAGAPLVEFLVQMSNRWRSESSSLNARAKADSYFAAATLLQRVLNVFQKDREADPSFWKIELVDEEREMLREFSNFRIQGFSLSALLDALADKPFDGDVFFGEGAQRDLRRAARAARMIAVEWKVCQNCENAEKGTKEEKELRAENVRLRAALHRDRTGLAGALDAVRREVDGRAWILDGRGNYEWDDERYRAEAGYALHEIARICNEALTASGNLAQQALFPEALGISPPPVEHEKEVASLRAMLKAETDRADRAEGRVRQAEEMLRRLRGLINDASE